MATLNWVPTCRTTCWTGVDVATRAAIGVWNGYGPDCVLGDTAYGNGPVRAELAEREVDVLAPAPGGKVEDGVLGKRNFEIDLDAGTVRCPAGHVAPVSVSKTGFRGATFSRATCRGCPLKRSSDQPAVDDQLGRRRDQAELAPAHAELFVIDVGCGVDHELVADAPQKCG